MTTIATEKGQNYIFSKGAPDFLFKRCNRYLDAESKERLITPEFSATVDDKIR